MVRVIIERHCREGKEGEMEKMLMGIRTAAMQRYGYISGETLQSVDDPTLWLVISTWADIDNWKMWETSHERREVESKIEPLLAIPEKVSIFSFARKSVAAPA